MAKNKFVNSVYIEGYLYEHKLEKKVTGPNSKKPGTDYIRGTISIATDETFMNVISVYFSYIDSSNNNFSILDGIVSGQYPYVMKDGKENLTCLRVNTNIALNDFYTKDNEFVSTKRNEGGFIHLINPSELKSDVKKRSEFEADIIINGFTRKEADESKNLPEKGIVKGAVFNWRGDILPCELSVLNPRAIDYFESLEPSTGNPVFTRVKGVEISQTTVRTIEEESAFGEPSVREVVSSYKDYVINWAQPEPYIWDDESTITAVELQEKITKREIDLAAEKKRTEDWRNSQNNASAFTVNKNEYNF
jgi:hypothetical protein